MNKSFFLTFMACCTLLSCRSDEDSIQKIDQIMNFYIQDANGKDLLRPGQIGSFTTITLNDNLAATDVAPISFSPKMTTDSIFYQEYIAGATRQLVNGSDANSENRQYRSDVRVALTKKLTDSTFSEIDNDTLQIFYNWTPSIFEVSKVFYNNNEVQVTKDSENRNIVKITK